MLLRLFLQNWDAPVGQFINYRFALEEKEVDRILYLAVPLGVYSAFFQLQFIKTVVKCSDIKLIIYDPVEEVIVSWKK